MSMKKTKKKKRIKRIKRNNGKSFRKISVVYIIYKFGNDYRVGVGTFAVTILLIIRFFFTCMDRSHAVIHTQLWYQLRRKVQLKKKKMYGIKYCFIK